MKNLIKCPHCGQHFDVEEALSSVVSARLEARYQGEFNKKIEDANKQLKQQQELFFKDKEAFEEKKRQENEIFKDRVDREKQIIQQQAKVEAEEAVNLRIKALEEENFKRKEENSKLKQQEIDLLKRENALKEKDEELQLKVQKQLLEGQKEIEEKARAKERENGQMKLMEVQKQLEDQKKMIEEMKRKAEQGSMQLQGEVQELALENLLRSCFPFDHIHEVPKGFRGADCIQEVVNPQQKTCGSIVYESKRTKNFSNEWIDKLKQDQINCKAQLAVLVTETMPSDMLQFGYRTGVWICRFSEVKSLSFVLREMLIRTHSVMQSQQNKGAKIEMLYNYFIGAEFSQNISRIIENYMAMKEQLDKEKRAMQSIWKQREVQILSVQENLTSMFGTIKGIAGNELGTLPILELPEG